jgi:hypothetical protein
MLSAVGRNEMAKRKPTDLVNLKVRFTEAMRTRIEQAAKKEHRSLNQEIVHRLAQSFGAEGIQLINQYEEQEKELKRMLDELVESLARKGQEDR